MGEDIHQKTIVKSKLSGKYIFDTDIGSYECVVPTLVEGRYYELFSVFGSYRGHFKPLPSYDDFGLEKIKDDLPDFYRFHNDHAHEYNYYSYSYYRFPDLVADLEKYVYNLSSPLLYYDRDSDDYDVYKKMKVSKRYLYWFENMYNLRCSVSDVLQRLNRFKENYNAEDSLPKKYFDLDDVIIMIYFDS